MPLIHQTDLNEEPRYDAETLRKVTALAQRIQSQKGDTLTAGEMEAIGAEIGLDRSVMRQALGQVVAPQKTTLPRPKSTSLSPQVRKAIVGSWWSAGWCLPFLIMFMSQWLRLDSRMLFFLGWGIYIGGGTFLSVALGVEDEEEREKQRRKSAKREAKREVSRADLLDALFTLQNALQGQKQHRAFLSVDVVGSSEMKRGQDELAVEYSFGQLQAWIADTARAYGGEMHSAAGDGMMCTFRDDVAGLRAARALQEGMAHFNRGRNRLPEPFRIRCGLSAGEIAVDPQASVGQMHSPIIDRAANLQKQASPGDIVLSNELAAAGIVELGGLGPAAGVAGSEPAFSWLAAQTRARLPPEG